ncbi:hypothetical protein VOLCADRAFT_103726 [Volvox carteri f. nagariensis]|uniref:Uncharacterized protein n=1 Tax=Volvox carteri f. nagariensis TaxID=3068 RepID=D8TN67_VOLCA|nr:uncharacterized protein VOLCADRAFT_103726 [Volvox carteri f. nagariensis]EFJ50936.1 hypothetical protein VOLCADRAFT_103726 [Volvox carteri f. nagariensis]|eukprot:XP_002947948.1 hypothetical protein VOLCADRAFT_103726 [Volvox carteri f. nagariensis]
MAGQKLTDSAWPEWQQGPSKTPGLVKYDSLFVKTLGAPESGFEPGHSTTTFVPLMNITHTKRPGSAPTANTKELGVQKKSPRAQDMMLKHRASALIQRYSGSRWREAQRTKWLIDIVLHIDEEYREFMTEQATRIAALEEQLQNTTTLHMAAAATIEGQNQQLRRRVEELEQQLRQSQGALLDMQNRVAASEIALDEAEEATQAAAEECYRLQQAVAVLAEHDAHARKLLSNRTHQMREALLASRGRVRQASQDSQRQRMEVAALLSQEKQKADQERAALTAQAESSMAAATTLMQAATRLEVDKLKLELEAYKEPWVYVARNKSPTRRKELSKQLGLKQMSFNVPVPF